MDCAAKSVHACIGQARRYAGVVSFRLVSAVPSRPVFGSVHCRPAYVHSMHASLLFITRSCAGSGPMQVQMQAQTCNIYKYEQMLLSGCNAAWVQCDATTYVLS
jgi:hypothetical protein